MSQDVSRKKKWFEQLEATWEKLRWTVSTWRDQWMKFVCPFFIHEINTWNLSSITKTSFYQYSMRIWDEWRRVGNIKGQISKCIREAHRNHRFKRSQTVKSLLNCLKSGNLFPVALINNNEYRSFPWETSREGFWFTLIWVTVLGRGYN